MQGAAHGIQPWPTQEVGMKVKELLSQLELGNSVAEFDEALEKYFVETPAYRALVSDKATSLRRGAAPVGAPGRARARLA